MTRVKKRVILAGLAGFVLLNAMAFLHARAMTRFVASGTRTPFPEQLSFAQKLGVLFTGVTVPRPRNRATPQSVGLTSVAQEFVTTDGQRLGAWRVPAHEPRALVVMHHGYAGAKADLLDEARILNGLDVETLLVDFRGSGDSSGDRTMVGVDEALDVAAVFRAVRAEKPARPLILLGQSMGAAAILRAVAVHGVTPDALILEAPFDRLVSTIGNRFTAMGLPAFPFDRLLVFWGSLAIGSDGFAHNPADYAASVRCPALVMNGDHDRRVSLEQVGRVHAALAGPKTLHIFTDTGHLLYTKNHAREWTDEVSALLARVVH